MCLGAPWRTSVLGFDPSPLLHPLPKPVSCFQHEPVGVMRWEAEGSAFRFGGVSGPSKGRDLCETPGGTGDAWLGEQSWNFPREGSYSFAVGLCSALHRAARGVVVSVCSHCDGLLNRTGVLGFTPTPGRG